MRQANIHYPVIQAIQRIMTRAGDVDGRKTVSLVDTDYDTILSLYDSMQYFLPGWHTRNDTHITSETDCLVSDAVIIVLHTQHTCYAHIRTTMREIDGVSVTIGKNSYLVSRLPNEVR